MSQTLTTFRAARADDLDAIIALLADDELGQSREHVATPTDPAYLAAFRAIEDDSNQLLAVVEDAEGLAGCLQISFIPGLSRRGMWRGQIEGVRIARRLRGEGLGRTMLEWAIDRCRERKCQLVQLTSDKSRADALRFYESLGFVASVRSPAESCQSSPPALRAFLRRPMCTCQAGANRTGRAPFAQLFCTDVDLALAGPDKADLGAAQRPVPGQRQSRVQA